MHIVHRGDHGHIRGDVGVEKILPAGKTAPIQKTELSLKILAPDLIRLSHTNHLKPVGIIDHMAGVDRAAVSHAHEDHTKLFGVFNLDHPFCLAAECILCYCIFSIKSKLRTEQNGEKQHNIDILSLCERQDSAAKEVVAYPEEHSTEDISVEALSRRFGYSKEHFCRKFKEFTGLSPMQYLKIFRVEEGCFKAHFGYSSFQFLREE